MWHTGLLVVIPYLGILGFLPPPNLGELPKAAHTAWLVEHYPTPISLREQLPERSFSNTWRYSNGITRTIKFWKRGNELRLDRLTSTPGKEDTHYVTVSGPAGFVSLQKNGEISSVKEFRRGEDQSSLDAVLRQQAVVVSAPWNFFETPISELIRRPGFTVTDVSSAKVNDQQLLKASWKLKEAGQEWFGWFLFDPELGWRLHEFARGNKKAKSATIFCRRITYSGIEPFPLSVEEGRVTLDGATFTAETSIDTVLADLSRPDPSVFRLQQFGIPELLDTLERRPRGTWRYWLVGIAGLVIAGWLLLRNKQQGGTQRR